MRVEVQVTVGVIKPGAPCGAQATLPITCSLPPTCANQRQVGRVGSSTELIAQHIEYMQPHQKRDTVLDCVNTVEARRGVVWGWVGGWE